MGSKGQDFGGSLAPNYACMGVGTSMAQPVVAGIASLVLSRRPDLIGQPGIMRDVIRYSSERKPFGRPTNADTSWVSETVGWGRVNAARALLAVVRGDADNSGILTISDVLVITQYIFYGGAPPRPHLLNRDADGSGFVTISDASYLMSYIFTGGPRPPISFQYGD
jgi:subtilisin family serine protease